MSAPFTGTPFALTASRETAHCWAGRPDLLAKLQRISQSLTGRPESSLDMIWANLGAGKSHALYFLDAELRSRERVVTALFEMPEQPKKFLDLYRRVVQEIPRDQVLKHLVDDAPKHAPDLRRAARAILHGGARERELAEDWLLAGRPALRDLRAATGIATRIDDDRQACDVLADVVRALAKQKIRLVILVDEFQRLSATQPRNRDGILANLRSVFSASPSHFSVVAAAASRLESNALALLPGELRTLMGMKPALSLPTMSEEEAFDFIVKRFSFFRPQGFDGDLFAPFGEVGLRSIVGFVARAGEGRLIPRTLMQACGWVYDDLVSKGKSALDPALTEHLLGELRWDD